MAKNIKTQNTYGERKLYVKYSFCCCIWTECIYYSRLLATT